MNYERKNKLVSPDTLVVNFLRTFRSQHTRSAYKNDLFQFFSFCKQALNAENIFIGQISETLCFAWRHFINDLPNKTLARKLSAISSFFKFCQEQGFIAYQPAQFLQRPKMPNTGKTNILTYEEIKQILQYVQMRIQYAEIYQKTYQRKLWGTRYAILYTLFTVGMRVEELCSLRCASLEHVENDLYRLHLITKGNKSHAPLIHPKTAKALLEQINLTSKKPDDLIFDMHRSNIYHMIKLCAKNAGIAKKISPHSLRASLATHLHKTGVPLGQIKDLLNHQNIATTLLYTKISDEELKNNANLLDMQM